MSVKFCASCDMLLRREIADGRVWFECDCGEKVEGAPGDLLVSTQTLSSAETFEKFAYFLANAARDSVNLRVEIPCAKCGLPYMTHVRLGEEEVPSYLCDCGHSLRGEEIKAALAKIDQPGA